MRIVSGKYKGKRFDVPNSFKARPTTDFAKESLFNILMNNYVDFEEYPSALDLFSGTGSISLEFLSRGCSNVVSIEKDYKHWQYLKRICTELGDKKWKPLHADVFKYVERQTDQFDIIFADPPYSLKNLGDIPEIIFSNDILASGGIFVLEHGKDYDFSDNQRFVDHRSYGSVNFSFFK
mgnify:FL=1